MALPYVDLFWTGFLSVVIGLVLASAFSAIVVYAQELLPGRVGMISGLCYGFAFGVAGLGAALLGKLADATSITTCITCVHTCPRSDCWRRCCRISRGYGGATCRERRLNELFAGAAVKQTYWFRRDEQVRDSRRAAFEPRGRPFARRDHLNSAQVRRAEAVEEECEDDQCHNDVGPVAFVGESEHGEHDAGHGRGDQEQQAELDDAAGVKSKSIAENGGTLAKIGWFPLKNGVMRGKRTVSREIEDRSNENYGRRESHARTQQRCR